MVLLLSAAILNDTEFSFLNGSLFSAQHDYDGYGKDVAADLFVVGMYGSHQAWYSNAATFQSHCDVWEQWFRTNQPSLERFLYLIDESANLTATQQWAQTMKQSSGVGRYLPSFATVSYLNAQRDCPALDIACASPSTQITIPYAAAAKQYATTGSYGLHAYNGGRPLTGSFCTDDDGTALRILPWIQYKLNVSRWFYWDAVYYNNYQAAEKKRYCCKYNGPTTTPKSM